jgi:xanthine/uracil/vitamin C permease (AzgA family)
MSHVTPASHLIPIRVHAILDYVVGALLMAAPWLFGFADDPIAMAVAVSMGGGAILYSLFTRYPLAIYPVIPLNAHLTLDLLSGLFLIASPWLCMFADRIWWPHVLVGVLEVGVTLLTGFRGPAPLPATERMPGHHGAMTGRTV